MCPIVVCPIGSMSNQFDVQFYRVQSVRCLILLCRTGLVSNPGVSNRFGVQSCCFQSIPLDRLLYYVTNPHVSNGFNYPIKLFVCPIFLCPIGFVSNRTCVSNAVVMFPIGFVSNWFGVQSYCIQLDLCPVFLCPITCVQSVRVQSECVQLGITPSYSVRNGSSVSTAVNEGRGYRCRCTLLYISRPRRERVPLSLNFISIL